MVSYVSMVFLLLLLFVQVSLYDISRKLEASFLVTNLRMAWSCLRKGCEYKHTWKPAGSSWYCCNACKRGESLDTVNCEGAGMSASPFKRKLSEYLSDGNFVDVSREILFPAASSQMQFQVMPQHVRQLGVELTNILKVWFNLMV